MIQMTLSSRKIKKKITRAREKVTGMTISQMEEVVWNVLIVIEVLIQREDYKSQSKPSTQETEVQVVNQEILEGFTSKIKGAIFPAKIAIAIFKQFQKRVVTKRTKFRGALELAKGCDLEVCVYTKSTEEKMPSLKKHSL
jgi:DNA gyrase/topoisomerase IV subunit B